MNNTRSLPLLASVRVASPCPMRWDDMEGDDRRRFCHRCNLHVHNLSAMSDDDAEALLKATVGSGNRLCGTYYQRADGTILTRDCPVGLAAVKARVRRRITRLAAALGLVATSGALTAASSTRAEPIKLRALRPFSTIAQWLAPAPPPPLPVGLMVVGEIACPSAPPPPTPQSDTPNPEGNP